MDLTREPLLEYGTISFIGKHQPDRPRFPKPLRLRYGSMMTRSRFRGPWRRSAGRLANAVYTGSAAWNRLWSEYVGKCNEMPAYIGRSGMV